MSSLPVWLQKSENYQPPAGKNRFLSKNILRMLSFLRLQEKSYLDSAQLSIPLKFLLTLLLLVLLSLAGNWFFILLVTVLVGLRMCFLPGRILFNVVNQAFWAGFFALVMLVPAYFMGYRQLLLLLPLKVFVSVSIVSIFSGTTPWQKLSRCLHWLGLPDILILTFAVTLQYINILGKICLEVLQAMQLRTVGRIQNMDKAFSGILGVTFLHAQSMAQDTYGAMCCRGFTGNYKSNYHWHWHRGDVPVLVLMIFLSGAFLYLETALLR